MNELFISSCFVSFVVFFSYFSYPIGNCRFENKVSKGTRFDFDPRALADRKIKREDMDLEGLQRVSDGKAAILTFFDQEYTVYNEAPDLSDVAIVHQETVVAKEEQPLPPTLLEIASQSDSAEKLMEAALMM